MSGPVASGPSPPLGPELGGGIPPSRRRFLRVGLMSAGACAGLVLSACRETAPPPSATPGSEGGELRLARLLASIEVLLVNSYDAVLGAARSGSLGSVPPGIIAIVTMARGHHAEHRDGWSAVLTRSSRPAESRPEPRLASETAAALTALRSVAGAADALLTLENTSLQTHVAAVPRMPSAELRALALANAPVEAQHAAVLELILGRYPVPDVRVKSDMVRAPADLRPPGPPRP